MDNQKLWYVVNTYSGHESKVKEKLEMRINSMGMQDNIFRVIIPEQKEIEVKDGVSKEKVKKMFPGYVLIEMIMSDEAWYVVRNTPGVTGFTGSSGGHAKPFPVAREQIEPVLKKIGMFDAEMYSNYEVNDLVKVLSGPFEGLTGNITAIDTQLGEVSINTVFFGRPTDISVKFSDVEKI